MYMWKCRCDANSFPCDIDRIALCVCRDYMAGWLTRLTVCVWRKWGCKYKHFIRTLRSRTHILLVVRGILWNETMATILTGVEYGGGGGGVII